MKLHGSILASRTAVVKVPVLPRADTYDQSGLQEVQLEDGSTAYIQHTVHMPPSNTILAIQADGTIADLQAEATALDPDTISVLEQYTTKVNTACHSSSGHVTWLNYAAFPFHFSFLLLNVFCAFSSPLPQVENIENPLSSYGRVEPDNGVHMRVTILEKMLIFFIIIHFS